MQLMAAIEYKVAALISTEVAAEMEAQLDALGAHGWQMCGTLRHPYVVFSRPRLGPPSPPEVVGEALVSIPKRDYDAIRAWFGLQFG
jgi:hypothetical protein